MAPFPAARFIPEFDFDDTPKGSTLDLTSPAPEVKTEPSAFVPSIVQALPKIEDAYQRGLSAGRAAALAEIEARLEDERSRNLKQLEIERYTWAERESEKLAVQIGDGLREITAHLGNLTARILRPFLADELHRQAVAELMRTLEAMLGKQEGITLEISGPEDLLQLLREKLSRKNIVAALTPDENVDVRIVAGQTILETCIGSWMRKVEERKA
jgi:hypothetical protein